MSSFARTSSIASDLTCFSNASGLINPTTNRTPLASISHTIALEARATEPLFVRATEATAFKCLPISATHTSLSPAAAPGTALDSDSTFLLFQTPTIGKELLQRLNHFHSKHGYLAPPRTRGPFLPSDRLLSLLLALACFPLFLILHPRMAPYISAKRKGIHIINLTRTARFLSEACDLVFDAASRGKQFLIVGTKNKAADSVARAAIKARCHYVNKKWLGGMLTNWYTTETRLHKFRDLRTEQKTGRLNHLPKRDAAVLKRQLSHLQTYLGGIKYMTGLPDIVIIVDQQEEYTALRECITLGIPTICLIDTNCDPDLADISIPANDDAIASIRLILNKLVFSICEGRSSYIRNS